MERGGVGALGGHCGLLLSAASAAVVVVLSIGVVVVGAASVWVWLLALRGSVGVGVLLSGPIRGSGFGCGWVHPSESLDQFRPESFRTPESVYRAAVFFSEQRARASAAHGVLLKTLQARRVVSAGKTHGVVMKGTGLRAVPRPNYPRCATTTS